MDYAENGTLFDLIRTQANTKSILSETLIYKYIYQIANGLRALHNNKYAHRDLRPENILWNSNNNSNNDNIKICDFASSSNKCYDVITHNIRSEIILEISRNTLQYFRAPEFIELYNGYQINEKSDIWSLGVILYMLLFSYIPKNQFEICYVWCGKTILTSISNEIKKILNPYFYELLRLMLKENPKERINANDVITYLEKYKDNLIKNYGSTKERWTFSLNLQKKIWMYMSNNNTKNIKAIVNKLMWNNLENFPEKTTINFLVGRTFNNKKKINKLYQCLSNTPLLYHTFCGLKAWYIIHTYVFNHNIDAINPQTFNIDELLTLESSIYSTRISTNSSDKTENIKNTNITKYIISYCDFWKTKIAFLRKHDDVVENNNSIITSDYYTKLINKNFIEDCLCLFLKTYEVISVIPFSSKLITNTLDGIGSILNDEWITMFNLIYFWLIAYKYITVENTNFENQFIQIGNKANDYLEKLRKYRNDINSSNKVILFSKGLNQAFDYWRSIRPVNNNFNIKQHFDANNNINYFGIKLTRSKYKKYETKEKEDEYDVHTFIEQDDNLISGDNEVNQENNVNIIWKSNKNNWSNNINTNTNINNNNGVEQLWRSENAGNLAINFNNNNNSGIERTQSNFKKEVDDFITANSIIEDFWNKEDQEDYKTINSNVAVNNVPTSVTSNTHNNEIINWIDTNDNINCNIIPDISPGKMSYMQQLQQQNHIMNWTNMNNNTIKTSQTQQMQTHIQTQNTNTSFLNKTDPQIIMYNKSFNNWNQSQLSNNSFPFQNNKSNNYNNQNMNNTNNNTNNNNNYFVNNTSNNNGNINHMQQPIRNNIQNTMINQMSPLPQNNNVLQNLNNSQFNNNIYNCINKPLINNNNSNNNITNNANYYYLQQQQQQQPQQQPQNNNQGMSNNINFNNTQFQGYPNNTQLYINIGNTDNNSIIQNNLSPQQSHYKVQHIQPTQNNTLNNNENDNYNQANILINNNQTPTQPYNQMNNSSNINKNTPQNQLYNIQPQLQPQPQIIQNYGNTIAVNNTQTLNNNPILNKNTQTQFLQNMNSPIFQQTSNSSALIKDKDIFESVTSQLSNINVFNIVENYNIENNVNNTWSLTNQFPEPKIEQIANDFLVGEFCKPNFQFLIASKDITFGKNIGFGGSSEVFIGYYRGTEVAIKKLRILEVQDENLKEFKREVSSLSMLRHPNWVLFMGAIAEPNNICIVTEYCAGGNWFNLLHQRREMTVSWALRLRILWEIATGMNFLHTNEPSIIHRDLKSWNILLTDTIEKPSDWTSIKISDFGLSKIIVQLDSAKETMTGQLGTCHWMAPEVIKSTNYSIKADVYSFAIIIWEICTRHTPYKDMTQQQISYFVSVNKGRPDKKWIPHNTPVGLTKLMELCWDDNPDSRPSFQQIISYLKKIKQNFDGW